MNAQTTITAAEAVPTIRAARAPLADALKFLCSIIERRNTIPILSGVLFEPESDGDEAAFRLVGTDLDIEAAVTPAALFASPRPFVAANAKALYDVLKASKAEFVTLELIGASLRVSMDGSAITLSTLPAADFPRVAFGEAVASFTLPGADLAADLARISPAISTEETRYYLNGIYVHPLRAAPAAMGDEEAALVAELRQLKTDQRVAERAAAEGGEGQPDPDDSEAMAARVAELEAAIEPFEAERMRCDTLAFAATDGHRMAVQHRPLPEGAETCPAVILPRKLIASVRTLLGKKAQPDAALSIADGKTRVRVGRWEIVSKLIDGSFPDYRRVIPSQNAKVMMMTGATLAECAKRAAAVADERTRAVHLQIDPVEGGARARFSVCSPENGVGSAESACAWSDDGPFEIGFNAAYLEKMGDTFGDAAISIAMADAACPVLFTAAAIPGFEAVLMPMRTDGNAAAKEAAMSSGSSTAPAAVPSESHYDRFRRVYAAAWANRDKAGLTRAAADYGEALLRGPDVPAGFVHATIAYEAANVRQSAAQTPAEAGDHVAAARRAEARLRAINLAGRGFVANGVRAGAAKSPGSFAKLGEACAAIVHLAALPGYDPDDPRIVLPVTLTDGSSTFVAAHDLAMIGHPCFSRRDAKGDATRKRRESNLIWRNHVAAVQPPKLSVTEQAGKVLILERENVALRERLETLETAVADLASRPAAVETEPEPEIAAPVPVSGPPVDETAAEAVEPPAPVAVLVEAAKPSVMGTILADLAERLEAAEAELARYRRARPVTAAAMRRLRTERADLRRSLRLAYDGIRNAQTDATDAEERANASAGRLHVVEAELARLAPLAAAIAGLVQPVPAPEPPAPSPATPAAMVAA